MNFVNAFSKWMNFGSSVTDVDSEHHLIFKIEKRVVKTTMRHCKWKIFSNIESAHQPVATSRQLCKWCLNVTAHATDTKLYEKKKNFFICIQILKRLWLIWPHQTTIYASVHTSEWWRHQLTTILRTASYLDEPRIEISHAIYRNMPIIWATTRKMLLEIWMLCKTGDAAAALEICTCVV